MRRQVETTEENVQKRTGTTREGNKRYHAHKGITTHKGDTLERLYVRRTQHKRGKDGQPSWRRKRECHYTLFTVGQGRRPIWKL